MQTEVAIVASGSANFASGIATLERAGLTAV